MMDISQYITIWISIIYISYRIHLINILLLYICVCMYVYKIMCNNILVHSSALVLATCCAILVNHKYREFDPNFHQVYTLCHYIIQII